MITDKVIKEIYKRYSKPNRNREDLRLEYFLDLLKQYHNITLDDDEIIINDLEEMNPFRRFLIRSLNGILEFDSNVAFVFKNHILFLRKDNSDIRIHIKAAPKPNFFQRLFGRR